MDISEIRWLSVWCTRFTVNFGEIFIPHDPKVPRRLFLERFPQEQRASLEKLRSDQVQLLDDKTFYIPQFYLDVGGERGFRFQASLRTSPDKFTVDIPNENNRYDDLGDYNGRDILIILPGQTTMYDIAFLAVIDSIRKKIIGRIEIPSSARLEGHPLPPSLGQNQQWWPSQSPPSSTPRYGLNTRPPVPGLGPQHTTQPPKLYSLPNCREFLGRKIRSEKRETSKFRPGFSLNQNVLELFIHQNISTIWSCLTSDRVLFCSVKYLKIERFVLSL